MAKSEIIKELANNEINLDVALSRLLIIASDLENEELTGWAESELNGYKNKDAIPQYRKFRCRQFIYSGINGSFRVTNNIFPFLDILLDIDNAIFDVAIGDSISSLQHFLDVDSDSYVKDYTWLSGYIQQKTGIQCTQLVQKIPSNLLENIVSQIKTKLLKIFLKLDKEYGCLDNLDINSGTLDAEKVQEVNQTINNYIYADNSIHIGDKNKLDGSTIATGGDKDEESE